MQGRFLINQGNFVDINKFITDLPNTYSVEATGSLEAVVQINLTGSNPSKYLVTVKDKKAKIEQGQVNNPTISVTSTLEDLNNIAAGKLDPTKAFMTGKVKVKGNMVVVTQMISILKDLM